MTITNVSMQGKTVLITGGTGGIGKETAIGLAKMGAHVVVVGRDRVRGEAGVADIKAASGTTNVDLLLADMSSQADIRRLAADVADTYPRVDVLINNVGGLYRSAWKTVDGIETTLAMNHLAPFLLTHLLLPVLQRSQPARVINVTGGFPAAKVDLDNLQAEKSFRGLETYSRAKVVMMIGAYQMAQRIKGTGVTLNVAYPGGAATDMTGAMTRDMLPFAMRVAWPLFGIVMRNAKPARAARSSIYLASSPDVAGINGAYFNTNNKQTAWPSKQILDEALRRRIWTFSEELTGLTAQAALVS